MSPFKIEADADEIPVGHHDVTITEAREISSRRGTSGVGVTLEDDQGRELEDAVWVTPSAYWKVEELWTACGLPWPYQGGDIDEKDLVGKRVRVELVEQEYDGKVSTRVHTWSPPYQSDVPADTSGLQGADSGGFAAAAEDEEVPFK